LLGGLPDRPEIGDGGEHLELAEMIDRALAIAARPDVISCSFGDMLRVPGSRHDLFSVKAQGGDVRVVYSPLDAVTIAQDHPEKQVVFFGVGFETTAPANAMAVFQARQRGLANFSMLVSHVLVPPAIEALMTSTKSRVNGFLAAGHVCTVMGSWQYEPLAERFHVPVVITGFEPLDVLAAMTSTGVGRGSTLIGRVTEEHPGTVVARTGLGATRVIDRPLGEQLPRIC
jgi:hydrogenase expression/formation protein HypD